MIINKEYLEKPGLSSSALKRLSVHPKYFLSKKFLEESDNIRIGNAVDFILTQGEETFWDYFKVKDIVVPNVGTQPYDLSKLLIKSIREEGISKDQFDHKEAIKALWGTLGIKRGTVDDLIAKFEQAGLDYVYYTCWDEDICLSSEEYNKVNLITESLRNGETAAYFSGGYDKQVPLYFNCKDHECKALLDLCEFGETIKPKDLKITSYSVEDWESQFWQMKYYYQAGFYTLALEILYPDKKIENFEFIVESHKYPGTPLIYTVSDETLKLSLEGGVNKRGEKIRGIYDLLDDLTYYQETNNWTRRREDASGRRII